MSLLEGYGRVRGRAGVTIAALSEEHGWLRLSEDSEMSIGDRLEVIPNHACPVVNAFDLITVMEQGVPVAEWKVAARGRMT